tara:strand:+ start:54 stop:257 length:204 start_codon:yes stop_codon:yes gene_type:complete
MLKIADKTFLNMRKEGKCGKVSQCTTISRKITFVVENRWIFQFFFIELKKIYGKFLLRMIFLKTVEK